jgi:phosphoribosylglycinamide formyltransferase
MVHRVIEAVDEGEPLVVEAVECRPGEELSKLEERIHEVEWRVIVQAVRKALDAGKPERLKG